MKQIKNNRKNRKLITIRLKNSLRSMVGETINAFTVGKVYQKVAGTLGMRVEIQPRSEVKTITITIKNTGE